MCPRGGKHCTIGHVVGFVEFRFVEKYLRFEDFAFSASEVKVYSKKYKYAGTLDIDAEIDGEPAIVDIKATNGIYLGHKLQTAAYLQARSEETGKDYKERWIIRLDKLTGVPDVLHLTNQKEDFRAFLGCLALYRRIRAERNGNR